MRETVKRERISVEIVADIHEIEGGSYWAEVPRLPGCIAQGESMETLKQNIIQAVDDWLNGTGPTGTLPVPLTADYVKLPYKNPPGRHDWKSQIATAMPAW